MATIATDFALVGRKGLISTLAALLMRTNSVISSIVRFPRYVRPESLLSAGKNIIVGKLETGTPVISFALPSIFATVRSGTCSWYNSARRS